MVKVVVADGFCGDEGWGLEWLSGNWRQQIVVTVCTVGGGRTDVVAAGRVARAAVELPRGTPVSERVVEKPEGDCWQRRGYVNVDQA